MSDLEPWSRRFPGLANVLSRPGPFCGDLGFTPGQETISFLKSCKVLVIGAGGLGCEILKNLALSGFRDIHVIDMDTIDVSNLNRQFLFRPADVGKSKAEVAAAFVMKRVKDVNVVPYHGKIQDKDDDYYSQFNMVICGLDSVEARRWINAKLVEMVDPSSPESLKPMIDGGTEGFKGQSRVILPTITSCYECSLDMLGKTVTYPICTIANTPRLPEHCIEWASVLEWPRVRGDLKLDGDNPDHISWVQKTAQQRAQTFGITGITFSSTQGVVKHIIPAIASTNAIVADNYMMYTGESGVYTYTFQHQKKPDCPVCGNEAQKYPVDRSLLLSDLIEMLKEDPERQLKRPSLRTGSQTLYLQAPPQLEAATRPNLDRTVGDLVQDGEEVVVTDERLPFSLRLVMNYR